MNRLPNFGSLLAILAFLAAGASSTSRLDAFPMPGGFWRDLEAPPALAGFTAVTGASVNNVDLSVDFPATLTDYQTVTVRKLAGATPPNADCASDGAVIKTYTTPTFPDPDPIVDTGTGGSFYSYRACIYDPSGNVTSSQTQANIQAKPGAYYTGITYYADDGVEYSGCLAPTYALMNDESVAAKGMYGGRDGNGDWIRADLGSVKPINRIRVGGMGPNGGGCWVTTPESAAYWNGGGVSLQFSNNATFTDMTGSNINASAGLVYDDASMKNLNFTTVNARYIRLIRTGAGNWIGTGQFRIGEF